MLEVQHLSKSYGPFLAVSDLNFNARKGEILGFLGPNGAGKTTTMRMITGYLPPSEGQVTVDGVVLQDKPIEAKRRTGYLPELPPLYPELTAEDYLRFVAQLKGIPGREIAAKVDRACQRCALADVRHRIIGRLSKGYRQRVGIAQAILAEPPLLILDEPTAGLDPRQIIETRELIRGLSGEHTIILSTHILSEAATTCDRVLIIRSGRLVAVDTPANLTHRLKKTDTLLLEVRGPAAAARAALAAVPGVTSVSIAPALPGAPAQAPARLQVESEGADVREALARAVVSAGWGLLELKPVEVSLEEIFLSLTAEKAAAAGVSGDAAPAPVH
ncbi:MAG: ATP-binding cassette domain-containing protein [Terriglobales bacterium]